MAEDIEIVITDQGSTTRVKRDVDALATSLDKADASSGTLSKGLSGLDSGLSTIGKATGGFSRTMDGLGLSMTGVGSGIAAVNVGANSLEGGLLRASVSGKAASGTMGQLAGAMQATSTAVASSLTPMAAQQSLWGRLSSGVKGFTADLVMHYKAERERLAGLQAGIPIQNAAADATGRHGALARAASGDLQGLAAGARALKTGLAALLSLGVAKELLGIEDAARQATITLTVAAGSSKGAAVAFDEIYASSQRTHSELQANIQFFSEMNNVFRSTQRDLSGVIPFMENFNRTVMLSGASGKQAAEAQNILNEAMLAGSLSSEQLGKLMAVSKVSVLALAEGLGMQTKTLERLASQGMITTGSLIRGFNASADIIQRMSKDYIPTLSQAWNNVSNSIFAYVNNSESGSKLTEALGKGMLYLAENMGTIAPIVLGVTAAFAVLLGLQVVLWAVAVTQGIALLAVEMAALAAKAILTGVAFAIANPATVAFSVAILALAAAVIYLTGGWDAAKKGLDDFVKGITGAKDALDKQGEKTGFMADLQKRFNGLLNEGANSNKKNGDAAGHAAGNMGKLADETQKLTNAFGEVIGGQRSLAEVIKGTTQSIRLASGEMKIFQGDAHTAAMEAQKDFEQFTNTLNKTIEALAVAQKAASGFRGDNKDFDLGMQQNMNAYGGERTGSDRGAVTPGMYGSLGEGDGGIFKHSEPTGGFTVFYIPGLGGAGNMMVTPEQYAKYTALINSGVTGNQAILGALRGFANGGSMIVGGSSQVGDRNVVQFRANAGEKVTVTPRDEANDNGRMVHVDKIEVNIVTADPAAFKRSERQNLQIFASKLAKAMN